MFICNLQGLGSAITGNLGSILATFSLYATRQPMVALRLDSVTYYHLSAPGNPPLCTHHNSVSVKIESLIGIYQIKYHNSPMLPVTFQKYKQGAGKITYNSGI